MSLIRHMLRAIVGVAMLAASEAEGSALLVSNYFPGTVVRLDQSSGTALQSFGPGSGLAGPLAARVGPDGKLYVTSEIDSAVRRYDPGTGAYIDTFITSGSGGLASPSGLDWAPDGSLCVASFSQNRVLKYDATTGAPLGTLVAPGAGGLNGADNGTVFGPGGVLYVPSYYGNKVLKYDGTTGAFLGSFATVARPRVILFYNSEVWVTSETAGVVRRFTSAGVSLPSYGGGFLSVPIGMAITPDGKLEVASSDDNRIVEFDAATGAYLRDLADETQGIQSPVFITPVPGPGSVLVLMASGAAVLRRRRGRAINIPGTRPQGNQTGPAW